MTPSGFVQDKAHDGIHASPEGLAQYVEHGIDGSIRIAVQSRHIRHLDRFLRRNCAPDLIAAKLYPDAKEITEAESMRLGIMREMGIQPKDAGVVVLVVGDGRRPRLGGLLAYTSGWRICSVDPKAEPALFRAKRLTQVAGRVGKDQDCVRELPVDWRDAETCIVAAPHSHAPLPEAVQLARRAAPNAALHAIASPCCKLQTLPGRETCDRRYRDLGNWSGRPDLQIWMNIKDEEAIR